jgi:hypothetical protein
MKPHLTSSQKTSILVSDATGLKTSKNATLHQCSSQTIRNIKKNWKESNIIDKKKKNSIKTRGKLTEQDLINIKDYCALNKGCFLNDIIVGCRLDVKKPALSKFLAKNGLKVYSTKSKFNLEDNEKINRFIWGCEKENWTRDDFKLCIFTDETTIQNRSDNFKPNIICQKGDKGRKFTSCVGSKLISVNVWGFICYQGGQIYRVDGESFNTSSYLRILRSGVLQLLNSMGFRYIVQDNLSVHRTAAVTSCIDDFGIRCLNWVSRSADLNPIENLWAILKNMVQVKMLKNPVDSEDALWKIIEECWKEIPKGHFQKAIDSMPDRIQKLLDNLGDMIDY